jgi:hypothetical protein
MDDAPQRVASLGSDAPRTVPQVDPVTALRALDRAKHSKSDRVALAWGRYRFGPDRHGVHAGSALREDPIQLRRSRIGMRSAVLVRLL